MQSTRVPWRIAALLTAFLCCAACSNRAFMLDDARIIDGATFRHVVIRNGAAAASEGAGVSVLHVYIEGDGRPGTYSGVAARDPSSKTMLMLRLMRLDPAPSIYLGRPCYLGLATDPACNFHYWTDRRFSAAVVQSLRTAVQEEIARIGARHVTLLGHSGGGALVVLLAPQISAVDRIMTLGGNLDTAAWAKLHGYAPLSGSLNPIEAGRLPEQVVALHWVGANDRVVPAWLVQHAAATIGGDVRVFAGFSHDCCWANIWPTEVAQLAR